MYSQLKAYHRTLYTQLKKAIGAPPMIATQFGDTWYVETNKGEQVCDQIQACCPWCAKAEGVRVWSAKYNR